MKSMELDQKVVTFFYSLHGTYKHFSKIKNEQ
jgi:hypothetical protein